MIWLEGENIVKGLGLTTLHTKTFKNLNLKNSPVLDSVLLYTKKIQVTWQILKVTSKPEKSNLTVIKSDV